MTTSTPALRRGARIETTGIGRTASWGRYVGTVLRVCGGSVFVQWDGLVDQFDEMAQAEVMPERPTYMNGCPCAQHDGKH